MEELERAAEDLGREMRDHPKQTSEAEHKIEGILDSRFGGSEDKYVNEGVNEGVSELEKYGQR